MEESEPRADESACLTLIGVFTETEMLAKAGKAKP
jgi:hypothetical protein